MNTTNAKFLSIKLWFTDQNSKQLEVEDNVNMTLIIGWILWKWNIQQTQNLENMLKVIDFCQNLTHTEKTEIDAAKTASKRVVHKTAETTGGLIGIK